MRHWVSASCMRIFVLFAACSLTAHAQQFQGSFAGTITDPSNAVVPGVSVTAEEVNKGSTRSALTLDDGTYEIPLLQPGSYRLRVEKAGFQTISWGPIPLTVNAHLRLDFQMKLGKTATTVTVEATSPILDPRSASVGTTLESSKVDQVPLNGRSFLQLMLLAPGVVPATSGSLLSDRGGGINVNGLRETMNSYWLDGLDDTSIGVGQFTVAPPIDSIQEFRMETGVYEAKFGAHAGAQANIVTKSGTNHFHGTLYDFLRNSALDARNFFEPSVPPFRRNQFGGTVGGPVALPRIYDGHDRTFFFFAYEGLRERRSFFNRARVPTLAERSGDFSADLAPDCSVQTLLIDPFALMQGQVAVLTNPLTGVPNSLPYLDPVGQGLVNIYPAPNIANAPCGGPNYTALVNRRINFNTYTTRVDHRWGDHDFVFFRYNMIRDHRFVPSSSGTGSGTSVPGFGSLQSNAYQMAGLDWTHTVSSTLFNEFKFGYNRWQIAYNNEDQGNLVAQQLGIQGLARPDPSQTGVPDLNFAGYDGLGADTTWPQAGAVNTFQLGDTVTHIHGNHSLAYGFDFRKVRRGSFVIDSVIRGEFDFTGLATNGLGQLPSDVLSQLGCAPPSCVSGNSVADALLGFPTFWINGFQQNVSGEFGEYDFFAQDTWRLRRNLTATFGLRYEYKALTTDQHDRLANFDFHQGSLMVAGRGDVTLMSAYVDPVTGVTVFSPIGKTYLGSTAENRSLQHPDRDDFAPRFGLAWQPFGNPNTVVRAGYGIFYDQTFGDVYFQKSNNPPFVRITAGNLSGALPLLTAGQLPIGTGALIQTALVGAAAPTFPTMSPFELNFRDAMIHEWQVDVQRELGSAWLVDVGYVGTRGLRLPREVDPNQPDPSNPALCVNGACPRRYPSYSGFSYTESSGTSIYHALQTKLERRLTNGLAVLGGYTFSKSMDTNSAPFATDRDTNFPQNSRDLAAEKALSDFDFRHRFTLAYVYDLPFGTRLWKTDDRRLGYLLRGWEMAGAVTAQSGAHFTPQISGNVSGADESQITGVGHATDRPDLTGSGLYPARQSPEQWVLASGFSSPAPFTFGNAGRNILRGPSLATWDFSVIRRFLLHESKSLEFRAEMFNIFNRPNFEIPKGDLASASFGKIFNTVQPIAGQASGGPGDPRELQFGLRLIW